MKKSNVMLAYAFMLFCFVSCDNSGSDANNTDSPSLNTDSGNRSVEMPVQNTSTVNTNMPSLAKEDSIFVMKAAEGGMMEVEAGNIALQSSSNDRVKTFATMMVNDHGKANSELMSLASKHGMILPTSLPADKQAHLDGMKKMQGKAFDKHYIAMMKNDHKNAIADFEKQVSAGADGQLKSFAEKTIPTLKLHRDSVTALSKMKL